MAVSLTTNLAAKRAIRQLARAQDDVRTVSEALSSGLRINRASDDAAGLAIATALNVRSRVFNQGLRNINDGISMLNIADGAVEQLSAIVIRIRELATQASSGTFSHTQRGALDKEADELVKEYNRITSSTQFNGVSLLTGILDPVRIQTGFGEDGGVAVSVGCELGRNVWNGSFQMNVLTSAVGVNDQCH